MIKPAISIILPVYNGEGFLKKCLESLVNQTLQEIEIIVVNDGSKDGSQVIIDGYQTKYPLKIKSFLKENGGIGHTRNFGIDKASGECIGFVDMDDYLDLDFFEKLYSLALSKRAMVVAGDILVSYPSGKKKIIGIKEKDGIKYISDKPSVIIEDSFIRNKIYKRELIIDNKIRFPENGKMAEDTFFTIQLLGHIDGYRKIGGYNYNRIIRKKSASHSNGCKLPIDSIDCTLLGLKSYDDIRLKKRLYRLILRLYLESCLISKISIFNKKFDEVVKIKGKQFFGKFIYKLTIFDILFFVVIKNKTLRMFLSPIFGFLFKIYKRYIYNGYSGSV